MCFVPFRLPYGPEKDRETIEHNNSYQENHILWIPFEFLVQYSSSLSIQFITIIAKTAIFWTTL